MGNIAVNENHKDYLISIHIKNNKLLQIMKLNGLNTAAELARACDVNQSDVGCMLNLTKSMRGRTGKIRLVAIRVARFFNVIPEVLYPEENHDYPLATNKLSVEADYAEIVQAQAQALDHMESPEELAIISEDSNDLLKRVHKAANTDRQLDVVFMRYGMGEYDREHTLEEIGLKYEITSSRARQIIEKQLYKIRWLIRNNKS